MKNKKIINLENIKKSYIKDKKEISVLKNINISFETGKFYAIIGHSGSCKTTLLNIIGMLLKMNDGNYIFQDTKVNDMKENQLSKMRMDNIGYIFQDILLNDYLTSIENVIFPMLINPNIKPKERTDKAEKLLKMVELESRMNHFPIELSGGEQQRVAIARALANNPKIILADEPTGNLDSETEDKIFKMLKKLSKEGKCVIVVSHSNDIKKYADYVYKLKDGKLVGDKYEN